MLLRDYHYYYSSATTIIIFCLLNTSSLVNMLDVRGAAHIVGDDDGWALITNATNWAEGKTFHVGDTLVFNYDRDLHNVMQVNSTAYRDCIKDPNMGLFTSGSDSLILADIGQIWYICGVEGHCESGQKLSINVAP